MKPNFVWWKAVLGVLIGLFMVGTFLFLGAFIGAYYWLDRMQGYDLHACLVNNAASNDFPEHPAMIEKIQQECICFKEKGYNGSKILSEGCSYE